MALLYATRVLENLVTENFDQKIGVQIIKNALKVRRLAGWASDPLVHKPHSVLSVGQTPVLCIATNAGVEGAIVVGKLLEQDNLDIGYDAAKGRLPT